jgi:hypothetical protein
MGSNPDKIRAGSIRWPALALAALLAGGTAGCSYVVSPSSAAVSGGQGASGSSAPPPAPMVIDTAQVPRAPHSPAATKTSSISSVPANSALSGYRGSLILNDTGAQLKSWNQTSSYCPETPTVIGDGTVGTDSSGDLTLTTNAEPGSCVALISPGTYSSNVIEAQLDFPALPGKPGTIANWTTFWMTNGPGWPEDGELDGAEVEPVDATNAVTWHSGTTSAPFSASTTTYSPVRLPVDGPNLTPGWHTVDIVYTKGFFAVYYDGAEFTSYTSSNITGDPLNIYFTMVNTPATGAVEKEIGSPPINSANAPATYTVRYLKVWSLR